MDFLDTLKDKAFLGREFLTWLWFKSEQSGGRIDLSDGKVVEVILRDRMTLDLADTDTPQTVTIRGDQSQLREGLAALKEGKKIEEARVSMRASDNEFTMVLKGTWFSFGSFATPPVLPPEEDDSEQGPEGRLLEKIALVEEGLEIVDALFEQFLRLRVSESWEAEEVPLIRRWIETETSAAE
jgi:recombination associated protein RdgC